ncbi:MAG: AAA family ATPase [Candidatus Harrisonbacteria bacterium CG10_big_fil_rev_8_21_14_0_10_49_15]|uniref:AAA family ATPase n=1 Tax=Candidatus Harrisonbacteria bacterium CG10_big_fil_rev_8_21_14_0_10_49_15 TaxID=1974587 RepID=A0A2H0UKS2_9BACT|nr:MAG: AAA family ATPase [Candidatus Harrisonbacteria bacterium CG10_big_fil_rev_8_21_14_0_10_49_15]
MTQEQALDLLKTGASVFLTGEPGSGKTHTVNEYVAYLRSCGVEPAITASTGIAATHIGGRTIHSWSGIGIASSLERGDLERIGRSRAVSARVKRAEVLIIDEVSMLAAGTLDMIDTVCRTLRADERPFGGLQVVLVGDFFQLPPISRGLADGAPFAFTAQAWAELAPTVCYLTEQWRQEDPEFLAVLKAIRSDSWDASHEELINSRVADSHDQQPDLPRLFTHNANVDNINARELSKLEADEKVFTMESSGADSFVQTLKRGCLSPEALALRVGAAVMCTKNSMEFGFSNGTLGTVTQFEPGSGHPIIQTRNGKEIVIEPAEWMIEEDGKIKGRIKQVPLRLAWAITIHKSQGMTMDGAVIDLSAAFEFGQGYVALSRVRELSGVHLLGYNERALQVHPEVLGQDIRFRRDSEDAAAQISTMDAAELKDHQEAFIKSCGGELPRPGVKAGRPAKLDTYEKTLALVQDGHLVSQIAQERGITEATVVAHLEKLKNRGEPLDLSKEYEEFDSGRLEKIAAAFEKCGLDEDGRRLLAPVRAKLGNSYGYDELRLARLLLF